VPTDTSRLSVLFGSTISKEKLSGSEIDFQISLRLIAQALMTVQELVVFDPAAARWLSR
jgi:hypothetical protein